MGDSNQMYMLSDSDDGRKEVVFTDRQIEIMEAWSANDSLNLISEKLGITENTVQTHLKRLRARLNVHRTVDVYLYMLRNNHLNNP